MPHPTPLHTLLKSRATLIELVLAAIVLGLGVNLVASSIAAYFAASNAVVAALGCIFTLLSLALIGRQTLAPRRMETSVAAFLCFTHEGPDLIPVPRYRYSEQVAYCLKALFAENEAPKNLWNSDPIHGNPKLRLQATRPLAGTTEAGKLIVEATEYVVLDTLSMHLSDYFDRSEVDSAQLRVLTREDLGPIVFGNRLLDTFSRPTKERAGFVSQQIGDDLESMHTLSVHQDGLLFASFDLVLPIGASVTRTGAGQISINAPNFCMALEIDFKGFGAVLPYRFNDLYLGDYEYMDVRTYKIYIRASIEFKRFSLLSGSGWNYHKWLDSFLNRLECDFSMQTFLQRIAWESAVTTERVVELSVARRARTAARKATSSE